MQARRTAWRILRLTVASLLFSLVLAEALAVWSPALTSSIYTRSEEVTVQNAMEEADPPECADAARESLALFNALPDIVEARSLIPAKLEFNLLSQIWRFKGGFGIRIECVQWRSSWMEDVSKQVSLELSREALTAGWPFPSLAGEVWEAPTPSAPSRYISAVSTPPWVHAREVDTFSGATLSRPLLLRPLWAGLAANTGLTAGGFWLLGLASAALRRSLRRRRNRCPTCNYDRRGLAAGAPCPECGPRPA